MSVMAQSSGSRPESAPVSRHSARRGLGLSREEEYELAAAIAEGDREARNRMIEANLGLVCKIASEFRRGGLSLDDLIGEGNLGLIRAVDKFDPRFGTRFSTYAVYWIKQSIRLALMNKARTIRVPVHMVKLLTKWRRAERARTRELGRSPSFDEIASYLGLSEKHQSFVAKACHARKLELECDRGSKATNWLSDTVVDRHRSGLATVEADEERAVLAQRLAHLDDHERTVLALRYGLGGEPLTLNEIGRRLGLCREWVSKIERRSLRKLAGDGSHPRTRRRRWTPPRSDRGDGVLGSMRTQSIAGITAP